VTQALLNYASMTDELLIRLVRAGDREAFRAIMQRCNQRLFRVARAVVGNDDEAEDVVQEAYLKAYAGIRDFRGEASLATWLTAITLNEARGRLRMRHPTTDIDAMDETRVISFPGLTEAADPEEEAARSGARRLLERAIDNLPGEFRIVFMLREIEGCSVEETVEQSGLNPQTVRTRLFRARRLLRAELEKTISSGMNGVFPFLGPRCARVTERVLARLAL